MNDLGLKETKRESTVPRIKMKSHEQLIEALHNGKATLPVDQINHREFVMDGIRYFCGYSSQRDSRYTQRSWDEPEYKVQGWLTYKAEPQT